MPDTSPEAIAKLKEQLELFCFQEDVEAAVQMIDALAALVASLRKELRSAEKHIDCYHDNFTALENQTRRFRQTLEDVTCGRGMFGIDPEQDLEEVLRQCGRALELAVDNSGLEISE